MGEEELLQRSARAAQQLGVFVILPIPALLVVWIRRSVHEPERWTAAREAAELGEVPVGAVVVVTLRDHGLGGNVPLIFDCYGRVVEVTPHEVILAYWHYSTFGAVPADTPKTALF